MGSCSAFSWYTYSPTRVRYPYVRGVLLELFREAKARHDGDPVEAWAEITGNPDLARRYKPADLPVASPQVFGDQTDVPESGDRWDTSYLALWGLQRGKTRRAADHDSGKDGLDYGHRRCGRPGTIPEPDSHGYQGSSPWLLRIRDGHGHHLDRHVPAGTGVAVAGAARRRIDRARRAKRGERLLRAHRADLELLRRGLEQAATPYVDVAAAVCALLPRLGRREAGLVHAAWEAGPPREEVGLEPFAPPEYLSGYGTQT